MSGDFLDDLPSVPDGKYTKIAFVVSLISTIFLCVMIIGAVILIVNKIESDFWNLIMGIAVFLLGISGILGVVTSIISHVKKEPTCRKKIVGSVLNTLILALLVFILLF